MGCDNGDNQWGVTTVTTNKGGNLRSGSPRRKSAAACSRVAELHRHLMSGVAGYQLLGAMQGAGPQRCIPMQSRAALTGTTQENQGGAVGEARPLTDRPCDAPVQLDVGLESDVAHGPRQGLPIT